MERAAPVQMKCYRLISLLMRTPLTSSLLDEIMEHNESRFRRDRLHIATGLFRSTHAYVCCSPVVFCSA